MRRPARLLTGLVLLTAVLAACGAQPPAPTATPPSASPTPSIPQAGPPYPEPISGEVVYDFAGVFGPSTEATASQLIFSVEELTGVEIVVYTQQKSGATSESTERDAADLLDQWGVGQAGADDGLAILFNLDETLCHGQVQLYAGPGYRANYLSNSERQALFEEEMVPLLSECDIGAALLVALERIEENARRVGPLR
jgi:uncharacterized membrane protein YgcG